MSNEIIEYLEQAIKNEGRENLTDFIEFAIKKWGLDKVSEAVENTDYQEWYWEVEDKIKRRERLRAEKEQDKAEALLKWEKSLHKIYADGLMTVKQIEVTYFTGGYSKAGGDRAETSKGTWRPYEEKTMTKTVAVWRGKQYETHQFVSKEDYLNLPDWKRVEPSIWATDSDGNK